MHNRKRFRASYNKLLVFTYRCTYSLTSTLLTNEFSVLGQSNARTQSESGVNRLSLFPCPTSVTALVQSLLSLLAHFCGTLCRLLCGIPMLISLDLGTPLPLHLGTLSLLGFQSMDPRITGRHFEPV